MKKFEKRVHWHFRLSIDGYGKNCEEALRNALEKAVGDLDDWKNDDSLKAIENHEVSMIDEDEFEDDGESV